MSSIIQISSNRCWQAVGKFLRPWTRLWQRLELWAERRRQRRALLRLPERTLKDLGINRVEALKEADKPFWKS